MKVPGMCGSLQDSWEGPYEITAAMVSKVNYKVKKEGSKSEGKVVHVNNLKELRKRGKEIFRIVVAEDYDEVREVCKKTSVLSEDKCVGISKKS